MKLLFICSRNRVRSLTAERVFHGRPGIQVRSAGTQPGSRVVVTEGLLGWADIIFFMEKSHWRRVQERYPEALVGKQLVTLRIEDVYDLMQPELVEELWAKVEDYLPAAAEE